MTDQAPPATADRSIFDPVEPPIRTRARRPRRRGSPNLGFIAMLVVLVLVGGVLVFAAVRTLAPSEEPTIPPTGAVAEPAASPPADIDDADAIAAFATQFAHDYLTWSEARPDLRAAQLAAYLPAGADAQLGWDGSGEQVAVLAVPVEVRTVSDRAAVVTVAVEITGEEQPRWVHLQVPIQRDDGGGLVVSGQPALVPRPPPATAEAIAVTADPATTTEVQPLVEAFLAAFAGNATVDDPALVVDDAGLAGLVGSVTYEGLDGLTLLAGDAERDAIAQVRWRDEVTASSFRQTYLLRLVDTPDGWRVASIGASALAVVPTS